MRKNYWETLLEPEDYEILGLGRNIDLEDVIANIFDDELERTKGDY